MILNTPTLWHEARIQTSSARRNVFVIQMVRVNRDIPSSFLRKSEDYEYIIFCLASSLSPHGDSVALSDPRWCSQITKKDL